MKCLWLYLTGLWLALPALASACPACKNALEDDPAAHGFARGIYYSIVVMLGVLFSLIGVFIWKLVQMARNEAPPPR